MPGWIENRLSAAEQRIEYLVRLIQDLIQQLRGAQQGVRNAFGQWQPTGSSSSGAFYIQSSSGSWGAAGVWPALTAGTITADVYQAAGASLTLVGTFTVYNWMLSSPVNGNVIKVTPDGAGNYVTGPQSCA